MKNCPEITVIDWFNRSGWANNYFFFPPSEVGFRGMVVLCGCFVCALRVCTCNCLFETMAAAVWPVRKAVKLSLPAVLLPLPICVHVTTAAACDCEGHRREEKKKKKNIGNIPSRCGCLCNLRENQILHTLCFWGKLHVINWLLKKDTTWNRVYGLVSRGVCNI